MDERAVGQRVDGIHVASVQAQIADPRVHPRAGIFFQKFRRSDERKAWLTPLDLLHVSLPPKQARILSPIAAARPKKSAERQCPAGGPRGTEAWRLASCLMRNL